jgi:hypothetical protein
MPVSSLFSNFKPPSPSSFKYSTPNASSDFLRDSAQIKVYYYED